MQYDLRPSQLPSHGQVGVARGLNLIPLGLARCHLGSILGVTGASRMPAVTHAGTPGVRKRANAVAVHKIEKFSIGLEWIGLDWSGVDLIWIGVV